MDQPGFTMAKIKCLQQLTNADNLFNVAAIDHRDVFVGMMEKAGRPHTDKDVTEEKLRIISALGDNVSGYLVDPHYSLPNCIYREAIPRGIGYMVNIEDNDYSVKNFTKDYFIPSMSVNKIKKMGASCVKLFFYYNPESEEAPEQEKLIKAMSDECRETDILLLLEPALYALGEKPLDAEQKRDLSFKMLERLKRCGGDIFKIDFPGDVEHFDELQNIDIARKVTAMLDMPWVIMSMGISIGVFAKQLEYACKGGASGFVVGRAIWQDFLMAPEGEREEKKREMLDNFQNLNKIAERYGRGWNKLEALKPKAAEQKTWFVAY